MVSLLPKKSFAHTGISHWPHIHSHPCLAVDQPEGKSLGQGHPQGKRAVWNSLNAGKAKGKKVHPPRLPPLNWKSGFTRNSWYTGQQSTRKTALLQIVFLFLAIDLILKT